jgi:hypothetical protein
MSEPTAPAGTQTARLVVSWLVVGIPLAYGLYQTIKSVLPLFGG